jgi:hypothetical protein
VTRTTSLSSSPSAIKSERYLQYLIARYAAMNITWQGVQEYEEYDNGRAIMRDVGAYLKEVRSV